MGNFTPALLVHGGAWDIPDKEAAGHVAGCANAAQTGWATLMKGGSAMDAVEAAILLMEDDPTFDAGHGAWLNTAGEVELDAIIMDGATLKSGAVAAVQHVRNPIRLARMVMERTQHSLIAGKGAEKFAQSQGMPLCDESALLAGRELERWKQIKAHPHFKVEDAFRGNCSPDMPRGTAGAVAIDANGRLAAGTSTGGTPHKLQGRVGDTPLIGCGCYADDLSAGASATGWGESIMKVVLCKLACDFAAAGENAQAAADKAIAVLAERAQGLGGVIVIDKHGRLGLAFNTPRMARAWMENGKAVAKIDP